MSLKQSFYQKPCWYYQGRLCRRASVCALYLRLLILFLTRQQQQQTVSCLCEPAYTRQEVKPMAGSAISHVVGVAQTRRLFHFPLHRWYLLVEGLERSFEDLGLSDNKVIPVFIWSFRLHFDVHPLRFSCYLTSVCLFKFFSRFFFFVFSSFWYPPRSYYLFAGQTYATTHSSKPRGADPLNLLFNRSPLSL